MSLAGEDQSFVFQLPTDANSIVFSSPDLKGGGTYTASYGGTYSGHSMDGICFDGTYSGGTDLTELTLSNSITTYGNRSMGMGNMGGRPGRTPGGQWNHDGQKNGGRKDLPNPENLPKA